MMGLSAVVPVLHGIQLYGTEQMNQRIGLPWLMLQGFLYVLGAAVYAVSFSFLRGLRLQGNTELTMKGASTGALPARQI